MTLGGCCCSPLDGTASGDDDAEELAETTEPLLEQMCRTSCEASFGSDRDECRPPDQAHPERRVRSAGEERECIERAREDRDSCRAACELRRTR